MWTVLSYWMNGMTNPILVKAYSAENYLSRIGTGLHEGGSRLPRETEATDATTWRSSRLWPFMNHRTSIPTACKRPPRTKERANERPLIDQFAGGNARLLLEGRARTSPVALLHLACSRLSRRLQGRRWEPPS